MNGQVRMRRGLSTQRYEGRFLLNFILRGFDIDIATTVNADVDLLKALVFCRGDVGAIQVNDAGCAAGYRECLANSGQKQQAWSH